MIRVVAIVALSALLGLALYLPSAHPPAHFLAQLRAEKQGVANLWGEAAALQMLARAVGLREAAAQATPGPAQAASNPLGTSVALELDAVGRRLFDNPYMRSIDALLLLAAFRAALLVHAIGSLTVLACALLVDGQVSRLLRAREFRLHDPERFSLCVSATIVLACAVTLALVWPVPLHPLLLPSAPFAMAALLSRALANFHRRG